MKKGKIMKTQWKAYIVSSPDVIRGKPRVKGTRIPVRDRYEITFPNGM